MGDSGRVVAFRQAHGKGGDINQRVSTINAEYKRRAAERRKAEIRQAQNQQAQSPQNIPPSNAPAPETTMSDLPPDRSSNLGAHCVHLPKTCDHKWVPNGLGEFKLPSPEQANRIGQVAVFGPMLIFGGLGIKPPKWVMWGMIAAGVGTILYNLNAYLKDAQGDGTVQGMRHGPFERAADLYRPTRLRGRR